MKRPEKSLSGYNLQPKKTANTNIILNDHWKETFDKIIMNLTRKKVEIQ